MIQPLGENIAHPLLLSLTQPSFIKRATYSGSMFLINIPPGLAAKIINLISPRIELDVSLITARYIKQIKAQSLAPDHRNQWRSREFRKLNFWKTLSSTYHTILVMQQLSSFPFFTVFVRRTCLELDLRELLHITVLFKTASFVQKPSSSKVKCPPQSNMRGIYQIMDIHCTQVIIF